VWRELIITDVTRMSGDKGCMAGIDHKGNCLRPELPYPQTLREHHLYIDQYVIRPRAVLDMFLEPEPKTDPPHIEDHLWTSQEQSRFLRLADDAVWRTVLQRTAQSSVEDIFQAELVQNKMIMPGTGVRSLGTLKPAKIDRFSYYQMQRDNHIQSEFRLSFCDTNGAAFNSLPITDLSLRYYAEYLRVQNGLAADKIRALMEDMLLSCEVWLRIGLTRPYQKSDEHQKWCFLQVNGIYTFPDYLEGKCFADFAV
jgi:hypothetical protein